MAGRLMLMMLLLWGTAAGARREAPLTAEELGELRANMTDNGLLLLPGDLPPLLCEADKDSAEQRRRPADFHALARAGFIMYCSFQAADGGDTARLVRLNEAKLDKIFGWSDDDGQFGNYQPKRDLRLAACTLDSDMPAGFFDFSALRPHEEAPLRCYGHPAGETALLRFRALPALLCTMDADLALRGAFVFALPGIAGEPFRCAFAPYAAVPLADEVAAQERLYRALTGRYMDRGAARFPTYSCQDAGQVTDVAQLVDDSYFLAQSPSRANYLCKFDSLPGAAVNK